MMAKNSPRWASLCDSCDVTGCDKPCYAITGNDDEDLTNNQGRPVGNIYMGRRFNVQELIRLAAGEPIDTIITAADRLPTREEMYSALFGGEERQ
jgi:hypothetical protein